MAQQNLFIIEVNFYKKKPRIDLVGDTTIMLSMNSEFEDEPTVFYLRDHSNMHEPRLNQVPSVAELFKNKTEAEKVAEEMNKMTFDEGRVVCKVMPYDKLKHLFK